MFKVKCHSFTIFSRCLHKADTADEKKCWDYCRRRTVRSFLLLSLEMSEHPKDLVETEDGVPSNSGMCVWRYNDGWNHECDRVQGMRL